MKKYIAAVAFASLSISHVTTAVSVSVIDDKAIYESEKGQSIKEKITKVGEKLQTHLADLQKKMQQLAQEIKSKAKTVSKQTLEGLQEKLEKQQRQYGLEEEEAKRKMQREAEKHQVQFEEHVMDVIEKFALDNKKDLVFAKSGRLLYASPMLDDTKNFITLLDDKAKK